MKWINSIPAAALLYLYTVVLATPLLRQDSPHAATLSVRTEEEPPIPGALRKSNALGSSSALNQGSWKSRTDTPAAEMLSPSKADSWSGEA